eukprot:CFRG7858T1
MVTNNIQAYTSTCGFAGFFVGSVQAAWVDKPQVKAKTVPLLGWAAKTIARSTLVFAATGAAYGIGESYSAGRRSGTADHIDAAVGGGLAGMVLAFNARSIPMAFGASAAMALSAGVVQWAITHNPQGPKALQVLKEMKRD